MFRQSNRGTVVWLMIIGLALALTLIAGNVTSEVGALLLAAYLALVTVVARNVDLGAVMSRIPTPQSREQQSSEIAQEAAARARNHPRYDAMIRLLDVGLIVDEARPDGMALRRGRFISLDDDGMRPFAIVNVPDGLGARLAHVRFELRNEAGEKQYVYEEEKWLQAGENILLPDYRLPIRKRTSDLDPGAWTLNVMVDNGLLGIHNFNLSPSLAVRRANMTSDGEMMRERVWRSSGEDESLPLSLEELLRQQSQMRRQQ